MPRAFVILESGDKRRQVSLILAVLVLQAQIGVEERIRDSRVFFPVVRKRQGKKKRFFALLSSPSRHRFRRSSPTLRTDSVPSRL